MGIKEHWGSFYRAPEVTFQDEGSAVGGFLQLLPGKCLAGICQGCCLIVFCLSLVSFPGEQKTSPAFHLVQMLLLLNEIISATAFVLTLY